MSSSDISSSVDNLMNVSVTCGKKFHAVNLPCVTNHETVPHPAKVYHNMTNLQISSQDLLQLNGLKYIYNFSVHKFLPRPYQHLSPNMYTAQKLYHLYQLSNQQFFVTYSSLLVYTQGNPNIVSNKELLQENKACQMF